MAKILEGKVVSTKMQDTVVVAVESFKKHPKYGKFLLRSKRYHAHAPAHTLKEGDKVEIKEIRPISKLKHFVVVSTPSK